MLTTSLFNCIKSCNLACKLILGCRIRLCSRKFQIFKIEDPPVTCRVVHLGPKLPQNESNVNNFSIKLNKMLKIGIQTNIGMSNTIEQPEVSHLQNWGPPVTSHGPFRRLKLPQNQSNVYKISIKWNKKLKIGIQINFVMSNSIVQSKVSNLPNWVPPLMSRCPFTPKSTPKLVKC